ncbi:uncharacterized protein LOC143773343 isoform X2 [Ranitomeya variabilis]|uniref:uncharacterized protein LOC143773343 isoform X2 n=1 Tax=Ranitomeya variabilis TaxID=490064 RepID=UPI004056CD2B
MTCFYHYSNAYNRFIRNDLLVITYPTPPYLLLREIMGPRPETPIVRCWRLKDSGAPKTEYSLGVKREVKREESLEEQYHMVDNMNASIQDKGGKFLVYDKTSGKLLARSLQGGNVKNKAIFEIYHFLPMRLNKTSNRVLVALRLKNTNLYLSCNNTDLKLQENAELKKNSISVDNNIGPFLFLREDKLNYTTFQSIMSHQSYISTMNVEDKPVVMRSDINQVYIEMRLHEEEREGQGIKNQQQGKGSHDITDTASYPYEWLGLSRLYGLQREDLRVWNNADILWLDLISHPFSISY